MLTCLSDSPSLGNIVFQLQAAIAFTFCCGRCIFPAVESREREEGGCSGGYLHHCARRIPRRRGSPHHASRRLSEGKRTKSRGWNRFGSWIPPWAGRSSHSSIGSILWLLLEGELGKRIHPSIPKWGSMTTVSSVEIRCQFGNPSMPTRIPISWRQFICRSA